MNQQNVDDIIDGMVSKLRENGYESERLKPVHWMSCTCCGEAYEGRQWWNQDVGFGLGDCCVRRCNVDTTAGESSCYGVPGIHFLIPADDHRQVGHHVGVSLHDVDEFLRITGDGYVYWKGIQIEHWSGSLLDRTEKSVAEARDLAARCRFLEKNGKPVSFGTVMACTNYA